MGVPKINEEVKTRFHYNFVGNRRIGYAVSAVAFVVSVALLAIVGLNYGVEFTGGSVYHYRYSKPVDTNQIRTLLTTPSFEELGDVRVQRVLGALDAAGESKGSEYIIKTKFEEKVESMEGQDLESRMDTVLSSLGDGLNRLSVEKIGPTVGAALKVKAFWCAFLGSLFILFYIGIRFQFRMAVVSIAALIHDCFILLGIFALIQHEFTLDILAALLTTLGYSINDSIIALDRIRENLRIKRKLGFDEVVNLSINQTLSRTLNTSITVQLAVLALLFIGPANIRDFALAMTIGVVVGTYSSIFIVSPMLVSWHYKDHPGARPKLG